MSWEAVTALGTVFTGVVIFATVVLGWRQLDHVRRSNELEGVMKVAETLGTERYQNALAFVRTELEHRMLDPDFRDELRTSVRNNERRHPESYVLMIHELIGTYVKHGLVSGDIIYDLCGSRLVASWRALEPLIEIVRAQTGDPAVWENAEWISREAARWGERGKRRRR